MKNPGLHKILALAFLLVALGPTFYALYFPVQKELIRHRMKSKLKSDQLQTLRIPEKEVFWVEGHEILVNGYMFDIATKELKEGIYTFTGIFDEEETELVRKQNQHQPSNNNPETNRLASLFQGLPKLFYVRTDPVEFTIIHKIDFQICQLKRPIDPDLDIPTPPPLCFPV